MLHRIELLRGSCRRAVEDPTSWEVGSGERGRRAIGDPELCCGHRPAVLKQSISSGCDG